MKLRIIFITILFMVDISNSNQENQIIQEEEEWIEPNAWGRKLSVVKQNERLFETDIVTGGSCTNTNDELPLLYFKKFISTLFNRKNLKLNDSTSMYCRSLIFKILPTQLERLESTHDPRELDSILGELISNMLTTNECQASVSKSSLSFLQLIWDITKDIFQLLKISEVRFCLYVVSGISSIFILRRIYGWGLLTIIAVGLLLSGYFMTYLECNRKLESEKLLNIVTETESWYKPITNWLNWNNKNTEIKEQIIKANSLQLNYCRPDHVLLLYVNDLFLTQLEFLIQKSISSIKKLNDSCAWYVALPASACLVTLIAYITKLTFKYVINPSVWVDYFHMSKSTTNPNVYTPQQQPQAALTEDRISGDNLKALLDIFSTVKSQPNVEAKRLETQSLPSISGVEEVKDQTDNSTSSSETGDTLEIETKISCFNQLQDEEIKCDTENIPDVNTEHKKYL